MVAESYSKKLDELYGYDAIHRLKDLDRGTLTTLKDAINDPQFAECWSLDATGNWAGYKQSDDGTGWSLEQSRTANEVNEITDVTNTVGATWAQPVYDRAGNMTTIPRADQPSSAFAWSTLTADDWSDLSATDVASLSVNDPVPPAAYLATYDAWNHLVRLQTNDGEALVSQYAYDGAKRRIVQESYSAGVLSKTRHLYYTEPSKWQVIEERLGTSPDSADAERQFVWGLRYIDDLVVRDRDTDATLEERLYACQDANWNVTAIVDNSGVVQERFAYSAYGMPVFLSSVFTLQNSVFDWDSLYCGYSYDSMTLLFHIRHRNYHAILGVWMERDPLGLSIGPNLYQYVWSRPTTYSDSFGLVGAGVVGGGLGIICIGSGLCEAVAVAIGITIAFLLLLIALGWLIDQILEFARRWRRRPKLGCSDSDCDSGVPCGEAGTRVCSWQPWPYGNPTCPTPQGTSRICGCHGVTIPWMTR